MISKVFCLLTFAFLVSCTSENIKIGKNKIIPMPIYPNNCFESEKNCEYEKIFNNDNFSSNY
jgi:hypothetical protein